MKAPLVLAAERKRGPHPKVGEEEVSETCRVEVCVGVMAEGTPARVQWMVGGPRRAERGCWGPEGALDRGCA